MWGTALTAGLAAMTVMAALAVVPAAGGATAPTVDHMVVSPSGRATVKRVSTRGLSVRVGRRRCAVPSGTALAALFRSRPGRIRLRDYGSCSRRPRDAAGLFVYAIGPDRNRGHSGWVYKVGRRAATAGAADPSGPFGSGRLRPRQRVLWFYCLRAGDCQRTLAVRPRPEGPGAVGVRVVGYDDAGSAVAVAGATVRLGGFSALTDGSGRARFDVAPGRYRVFAAKRGMVSSFPERVVVR